MLTTQYVDPNVPNKVVSIDINSCDGLQVAPAASLWIPSLWCPDSATRQWILGWEPTTTRYFGDFYKKVFVFNLLVDAPCWCLSWGVPGHLQFRYLRCARKWWCNMTTYDIPDRRFWAFLGVSAWTPRGHSATQLQGKAPVALCWSWTWSWLTPW